jgi:prepilin-type N-terminal cleavage/methylation domain-containing protein
VKNFDRKKKSAGFTLLEVMVAMTIVGIGVVTLLQVFSLGLRLQSRSNAQTDAMIHGARIMDELLARRRLDDAAASGKLPNAGRWTTSVQTARDTPTTLGLGSDWELREVALDMIWRDGERDRQVALKTLRLSKRANP